MTPHDRIPFAHNRAQDNRLRRLPLEALSRETRRPIMRVLHATLWTLVVFVFGALAYFHFTATPAFERHPATTAEGVGRVVTGEQL